MSRLHDQLPELVFSVSIHDLETITQFFLVKSVTGTSKTEDKEEAAALEDRLVSYDLYKNEAEFTLDARPKSKKKCTLYQFYAYGLVTGHDSDHSLQGYMTFLVLSNSFYTLVSMKFFNMLNTWLDQKVYNKGPGKIN
jgi:hypothetical protein